VAADDRILDPKLERLREAGTAMMMKMPTTKVACNFVSATRRPASSDS
jgi:hypothetical protein